MEKEMKVSQRTIPKYLASAILLALKDGNTVKLNCIGQSIRPACVALALANKLNDTGKELKFTPLLEQLESDEGRYSVVIWKVELI